jgi:Sterol-sensing domain of SREBP cleavage-activation/Patched family
MVMFLSSAIAAVNSNESYSISKPPEYCSSDGETVSSHHDKPIFPLWTKFTNWFRSMITGFTVALAVNAARNPKTNILVVTLLSFGLLATGFFTNFNVNTDEQVIYAPFKSRSKMHHEWIKNDSNFPGNSRVFTLAIHANGDNILGSDYLRKVFQALDIVRAVPGYEEVCAAGDHINFDGIQTCKIVSVTRFFKDDMDAFEKAYAEGGDEGVTKIISADTYENLTPVDTGFILGNNVKDEETGLISFVQSYNVFFFLANADEGGVDALEGLCLDRMAALRVEWANDGSPLELEYFSMRSYSDEFARAIQKDLFLLPLVFLLMSAFTCMVFFRCDVLQSRTALGVGSVVTILLSLMGGFGLMFSTGVPFTSLTQIIPFVIFGKCFFVCLECRKKHILTVPPSTSTIEGVGLDDTFIITGAYFRTDPDKEPAERIREVMQEVGLSISSTTLTTTVAFCLGCTSSIPAIFWLNLYAIPTILMDFFFQLTFFVGRSHCCVSCSTCCEGYGEHRHADTSSLSFANFCEQRRFNCP